MKIIETKECSAPSLFNLFLLADPSREMIEQYVREGHTFVGMHEDRVIAAIVLLFTAADVVEIKNVAVLPEHQGKGIGSLL
ncbi:MAG: GNAT family N-acetyltransferase, partial [Spirochaetae bacterium HGW-Spirochaetae-10]